MGLLEQARQVHQETQLKVERITTLTSQARELLVNHGDPRNLDLAGKLSWQLNKTLQPHKAIVKEVKGVRVEIFSYSPDMLSRFMDERSIFVILIPGSEKGLSLEGKKSIIQDRINHPDSPKSITQISLAELNEWGEVIQLVEESFRFGQ